MSADRNQNPPGNVTGSSPDHTPYRRELMGAVRNIPIQRRHNLSSCGLQNPRNTECFALSAIQALIHHPRVAMFLRYHHVTRGDSPRIDQHMYANKKGEKGERMYCALCQLYELLVRYWTRTLNDNERYDQVESRRSKLLDRFRNFIKLTAKYPDEPSLADIEDQHDAGEFYTELYKWMEHSLRLTYQQNPDNYQPGDNKTQIDALDQLMTMGVMDICRCVPCGHRSFQPREQRPMLILGLPNEKSIHKLQPLLDAYFQEEEVQIYCNECENSKQMKATRIVRQPDLLCLQISRVGYNQAKREAYKRLDEVQIPDTLDLNAHKDERLTSKLIYKLHAVVKHRGESIRKGHYIAWVKKDDQWNEIDDEIVTASSFDEAIEDKASDTLASKSFMLFYALDYDSAESLLPSPSSIRTRKSTPRSQEPAEEQHILSKQGQDSVGEQLSLVQEAPDEEEQVLEQRSESPAEAREETPTPQPKAVKAKSKAPSKKSTSKSPIEVDEGEVREPSEPLPPKPKTTKAKSKAPPKKSKSKRPLDLNEDEAPEPPERPTKRARSKKAPVPSADESPASSEPPPKRPRTKKTPTPPAEGTRTSRRIQDKKAKKEEEEAEAEAKRREEEAEKKYEAEKAKIVAKASKKAKGVAAAKRQKAGAETGTKKKANKKGKATVEDDGVKKSTASKGKGKEKGKGGKAATAKKGTGKGKM